MQEFWRQMEGLAVQQGEWTSGHCTEHIKMVQTVHLNLCVFMRILPQLKKLYSSTVRLCLLGNLPSPSSHLDLFRPAPLLQPHWPPCPSSKSSSLGPFGLAVSCTWMLSLHISPGSPPSHPSCPDSAQRSPPPGGPPRPPPPTVIPS